MIIILSPSKLQNFKPQTVIQKYSQPKFTNEAAELVDLVRQLEPSALSRLLSINTNLTQQNFDRFFNWHLPFSPENAKQAALAYDGEAFRGLKANGFTEEDFEFAQSHLRILSGLYGVLRPLDLIQPYRLEVSSKLQNTLGRDLYAFWRDKITSTILSDLKVSGEPAFILNLASAEYTKVLMLKNSNTRIVDVEFYEYKEDKFRQVVIYTKKARGMMSRYVIVNKIETEEDLKGFSEEGYWYNPQMSSENKLVFVR